MDQQCCRDAELLDAWRMCSFCVDIHTNFVDMMRRGYCNVVLGGAEEPSTNIKVLRHYINCLLFEMCVGGREIMRRLCFEKRVMILIGLVERVRILITHYIQDISALLSDLLSDECIDEIVGYVDERVIIPIDMNCTNYMWIEITNANIRQLNTIYCIDIPFIPLA